MNDGTVKSRVNAPPSEQGLEMSCAYVLCGCLYGLQQIERLTWECRQPKRISVNSLEASPCKNRQTVRRRNKKQWF